LPKKNRNLGERKAAVIFRRGVRVRKFESSDAESLFDYNLNELTIDEARKASDWDVKYHCGRALVNADKDILARLFDRLMTGSEPVWEFGFDIYSLRPSYSDNAEDDQRRKQNWQDAFSSIAGEDAVLTGKRSANQLERKGYKPVEAPESLVNAAELYGVQTPAKVLTSDELFGRAISDPTPDVQAAVDFVWELLEEIGLTNGKQKPPVKCFTSILDGGVMLNGYYRDGTVFIHEDLGRTASLVDGRDALSDRLLKVALEEITHWVTQSTDNSRDFQNYLLDVAVKLCRKRVKLATA
jgi:hypothetical protein